MPSLRTSVVTLTAAVGLPLAVLGIPAVLCDAQSASATVSASAQAQTNVAVSDRYLTPVDAELTGKLDSKNAVTGQEVTARTTATARLADGTTLPRGTKLVGHVTAVQAHSKDSPYATLAISFDRAEVKDGQSIALRSVIRALAPPTVATSASGNLTGIDETGLGGGPSMGGRGGVGMGGGMGGGLRGVGQTAGSAGQTAGSTLGGAATRGGRSVDPITNSEGGVVTQAGESVSTAPHATALPGVMLSASATADVSGTLMASGKNILLDSGTQITLGVIGR